MRLTNEQWKLVEHLFTKNYARGGAHRKHSRRSLVECILSVQAGQYSFRTLPKGCPPFGTVSAAQTAWARSGLWEKLLNLLYDDKGRADYQKERDGKVIRTKPKTRTEAPPKPRLPRSPAPVPVRILRAPPEECIPRPRPPWLFDARPNDPYVPAFISNRPPNDDAEETEETKEE